MNLPVHVFAICAYKDSPYLEDCIRSLKGQRTQSPIILCTSTPSLYIQEMARAYGIPVSVREGASGIGRDWNFAYHKAQAELVTIAHQDDVYHKDYVTELLRAYEQWPDMTMFTSDYVMIKNGKLVKDDGMLWIKRLLRLPLRFHRLCGRRLIKQLPLMLGNSICCPASSYNKKLLGEPLFPENYDFALDWENLRRLALRPGRLICRERPLLYYRVHEGAATKECIVNHKRAREEEEMFCRFWPGWMAKALMLPYRTAYGEYESGKEKRSGRQDEVR